MSHISCTWHAVDAADQEAAAAEPYLQTSIPLPGNLELVLLPQSRIPVAATPCPPWLQPGTHIGFNPALTNPPLLLSNPPPR